MQTYNFHFPLSVTVAHMCITFSIAGLVRKYRASRGANVPTVSWEQLLRRVYPAG